MFNDIREKYEDDVLLGTELESIEKRMVARDVMDTKARGVMLSMLEDLRPLLIETCHVAINTPYLHKQDMIRVIFNGQETIPTSIPDRLGFIEAATKQGFQHIVKIIGLEIFSPFMVEVTQRLQELLPGDWIKITIQAFWTEVGAISYPLHLDVDEVLLVMLEGSKQFRMGAQDYHMLEDDITHEIVDLKDTMYIPAYKAHEAINTEDNLMLSIGFEYPSSDKLNYMD